MFQTTLELTYAEASFFMEKKKPKLLRLHVYCCYHTPAWGGKKNPITAIAWKGSNRSAIVWAVLYFKILMTFLEPVSSYFLDLYANIQIR